MKSQNLALELVMCCFFQKFSPNQSSAGIRFLAVFTLLDWLYSHVRTGFYWSVPYHSTNLGAPALMDLPACLTPQDAGWAQITVLRGAPRPLRQAGNKAQARPAPLISISGSRARLSDGRQPLLSELQDSNCTSRNSSCFEPSTVEPLEQVRYRVRRITSAMKTHHI